MSVSEKVIRTDLPGGKILPQADKNTLSRDSLQKLCSRRDEYQFRLHTMQNGRADTELFPETGEKYFPALLFYSCHDTALHLM